MNNKLTLRNLSDKVSEEINITKNDCYDISKALMETIVEQIAEGNEVVISGLGTFKRVKTASRKRFNFATGTQEDSGDNFKPKMFFAQTIIKNFKAIGK